MQLELQVQSAQIGFFTQSHAVRFFNALSWVQSESFWELNHLPLSGWTDVYWFIHLLRGILLASKV